MMKNVSLSVLSTFILLIFLSACQEKQAISLCDVSDFDTVVDGKQVELYTLTNTHGLTMQVTNYGARVVSLWIPDREGKFLDVVLGYDNIDDYLRQEGERFLGAAIGRYGNRIANGRFTLDGTEYSLATFNNGQCLHGGEKGFDRVVWNVESVTGNELVFSYLSPDMEEGFPGNLSVKMVYRLTDDNQFVVTYEAKTDKATPINLTHHSFFNLRGEGNGSINDHILYIAADSYTPVNNVLIPIGESYSVDGTPFDFRQPMTIGARVDEENIQLTNCLGYDHNFVLNRTSTDALELAASVLEPESGRYMEVWTTEPGIQFYGGNFFDGKTVGKCGGTYDFRGAFALETQHFPDSPNQPNFPNTILRPGETYRHICEYRFGVR